MPRKTSRRHAGGEASRQVILEAALTLAGQRGYVGTTVALVTKATGLPASSVYWHFKNKDELLAAALRHGYGTHHALNQAWRRVEGSNDRHENIQRQLALVVEGLTQERGFWRMGLLIALETGPQVGSGPREGFLEIRATARAAMVRWWSELLDEAPRSTEDRSRIAGTMADFTMVAVDGLFLAHQAQPGDDVALAADRLADGLAAVVDHLLDAPEHAASAADPAPAERRVVTVEDPSSRTRLLSAAAEVAAESGYEGASISRICARAGLPASSLYWHFKDKDDLMASVIEHSYTEWFVNQPPWLPPSPGIAWQDHLRGHFAVSMRSLRSSPLFLRMGHLLLLLRHENPPAARERFIAVRRQARVVSQHWYSSVLSEEGHWTHAPSDVSDATTASAMSLLTMALSDGLYFSFQVDDPVWDVDRFSDLLVRVLAAAADAPATVSAAGGALRD